MNEKGSKVKLDEVESEAIQMELEIAFKNGGVVTVLTNRKGYTEPYIGKISTFDLQFGHIAIDGPFGDDRILIEDIIKVNSTY